MLLVILLIVFGLMALIRKEIPITRNRKVTGTNSQVIGIILLLGAILNYSTGGISALVALGIAIVYGFTQSSK